LDVVFLDVDLIASSRRLASSRISFAPISVPLAVRIFYGSLLGHKPQFCRHLPPPYPTPTHRPT
jgi:hypothetical protein